MTASVRSVRDVVIGDQVLISNEISYGNLSSSGLARAVVRRLSDGFVEVEFADGSNTIIPLTIFQSSIAITD